MSFTVVRKIGQQFSRGLLKVKSSKISRKFSLASDNLEPKHKKSSVWTKEKLNEEYYFHQKEKEQLKALKQKLKRSVMENQDLSKML